MNHLYEFYYRSQAVNQEFLTRVRNKKTCFPNEASLTLEQFLYTTNLHPRFNYRENSCVLDEYLLGNGNWRDASTNSLRPEVQRYLIWALDFTPTQKYLGWSEAEWLSEIIQGIVNTFNRHRSTYPNIQSAQQTAQTNPFPSTSLGTEAAWIPPAES